MRKSYDFSKAVRGVHYRQYAEGHSVQLISEDGEADGTSVVAPETNEKEAIAILEPDVAAVFSDSKSVNEALRVLIKAAAQVHEPAKAS